MRPIDERVIEAAARGELSVDDAADLVETILSAYSAARAAEIIESLGLRRVAGRGRSASGPPPPVATPEDLIPWELVALSPVRQRVLDALASAPRSSPEPLVGVDSIERRREELGSRRPTVLAERQRSRALSLVLDGEFQFPAFQFGERWSLIPEAATVNEVLGAADDPWGVAGWWVQPNGRIGDRPIEWLRDLGHRRDLVALARASAEAD